MARFAPKNTLPALGGLLGAALLIGYAPAAAEGAMRGLSACGRVILPAVFSLYFDFFDGLIQAYVFVFLTGLFIKEAIED